MTFKRNLVFPIVLLAGAGLSLQAVATQASPPATATPTSAGSTAPSLTTLQQRAETGNAVSETTLGYRLLQSKNATDQRSGVAWLRKAATHGNADAEWLLGNAYVRGRGTTRDPQMGLAWMRKAAASTQRNPSKIDANRMAIYGVFAYTYSLETGNGDSADAIQWIQRGADAGAPSAMAFMGGVDLKGIPGMNRPKDPAAAQRWLTRAARLGNANAQTMLGQLDIQGAFGKPDRPAGLQWLRTAAHNGDGNAQGLLGVLLITGSKGVQRDAAAGVQWAKQAIASGDVRGSPLGYYAMGYAYKYGRSVTADAMKAWYNFAAAERFDTGHTFANVQAEAADVSKHLSTAQIKRMQSEVDQLPKPSKKTDDTHFTPLGATA